MEDKSCYYECLVGLEPDSDMCIRMHPNGCDDCDWYLVDPSPENHPVPDYDPVF